MEEACALPPVTHAAHYVDFFTTIAALEAIDATNVAIAAANATINATTNATTNTTTTKEEGEEEEEEA